MFNLHTTNNGIKYFKSDILKNSGLVHCFSTRVGGNTPKPFDSFPLGIGGVEELKEEVLNNRSMICKELGILDENIVSPVQTHTSIVKVVKCSSDNLDNVDGVITDVKNLPLFLSFADCTPIIMYAPIKNVIGVIHAGWRGTAEKICINALELFEKEFDILPSQVCAAIGPTISSCCYEVSEEVAIELSKTVSGEYAESLFLKMLDDKFFVDIAQINACQLRDNGVENIDVLGCCTSCNNHLFYSYRKENGVTGRHAAIACLV